ncbi:hypothetical protein FV139_17680 [Parahaliea maris]|uniref:Primase C-terminal 2 domain-containing protein n=1 Tax=Parahaliea maris TaxID=2716870 RepID=A0A5C8ZSQ1_9GAMM|nr:hypothetical protein FV139_17680 [Parahaliea maris]
MSDEKQIERCSISHIRDLPVAPPLSLCAVFRNNGKPPPSHVASLRPPPKAVIPPTPLTQRKLDELEVLVNALSPDISYGDWVSVGMILSFETGNSCEGFAIWDQWSSRGSKYPGISQMRAKWGSFKP